MLELIMPDKRGLRKGDCCVSISGKFKRVLLFKGAYEDMRLYYGQDFEFVQFFTDKETLGRFWIRPGTKELPGVSRVALNPKNGTRTISAAYLLKALGWSLEVGVRCPISWDSENNAAVVIINSSISALSDGFHPRRRLV